MYIKFKSFVNEEIDTGKLKNSKIGRDFLKYMELGKKQPSTDELLDWRNRLEKKYKGEFPDYVKIEIDAVDEILRNLNENMNLEIENNIEGDNEEITKKIIDEFSFIVYKQKARPKSLRVKKLSGYYNNRDFKNFNLIYKTKIIIELSNYDIVEGKLSVYNDKNENNIIVKINDNIVYNLDNQNFNNEKLIEKMKMKYQNYIQKDYKTR